MALIVTQPLPGYARLRFVTDANDILAKLIRFDTMSTYVSHVEAVLPDGIIGAYWDGVKKQPIDYDTGSTAQTFVDIPMADAILAKWVAILEQHIGKAYDYWALIGFALHENYHTPGTVICSALQTLCLRDCEFFRYPLSVLAHQISPRDLFFLLSGRQEYGVIIHDTETKL